VRPGQPIVTRRQLMAATSGFLLLWAASDWPIHDIAEERLYFVHMIQHTLMTFVVPPVFLLATPEWLGRFLLGDGRVDRVFHRLAKPLPAAVIFNVFVAVSHWSWFVNHSVQIGALHYTAHALLISSALLVWTPICGPFPELRMSPPSRMIYLFMLSIIPTIPSAWLTASTGVLYSAYDHDPRLWGVDVISDQQLAGVVMKLGGAVYLWSIIVFTFFRWMASGNDPDKKFRGTFVPTVHPDDTEVPELSRPSGRTEPLPVE
jgi:putative membrane protein